MTGTTLTDGAMVNTETELRTYGKAIDKPGLDKVRSLHAIRSATKVMTALILLTD